MNSQKDLHQIEAFEKTTNFLLQPDHPAQTTFNLKLFEEFAAMNSSIELPSSENN